MEDAMIQAMLEELELEFEAASTFVAMHISESKFTDDVKLKCYGLFKQATVGPCNVPKPGMFDMKGKAKWSAWKDLGSISQEEAMVRYIEIVASIYPEWKTMGGGKGGESGKGGPMGPVISTLAGNKDGEGAGGDAHASDTLHGAASRGDCEAIRTCLGAGANINDQDEAGCAPLHWACDQGHLEAVKLLVDSGADVNAKDEMGFSPLHLASANNHANVVRYLASLAVTNVGIQDEDGLTPLMQALNEGNGECAKAILESGKTTEQLGGKDELEKAKGAASKSDMDDLVGLLEGLMK